MKCIICKKELRIYTTSELEIKQGICTKIYSGKCIYCKYPTYFTFDANDIIRKMQIFPMINDQEFCVIIDYVNPRTIIKTYSPFSFDDEKVIIDFNYIMPINESIESKMAKIIVLS